MTRLYEIQEQVRLRIESITSTHASWPCRKGCDDCCRRLASAPRVTRQEWERIVGAVESLPAQTAELTRRRIRESTAAAAPVICPLLDRDSGTCLVYESRPVACRAYGFYAERQYVLGCDRIEAIGQESPDVVWGNHAALEEEIGCLGEALELSKWLGADQQ